METAVAAAVARRARVAWAALRAVTDRAGPLTTLSFARNYPTQAGRAADTVLELLAGPPAPDRSDGGTGPPRA